MPDYLKSPSFLLLVLFTFTFVLDPIVCQSSNSTCVSKKTCGECIRTADCVWCSQPIFNNDADLPLDRCNTPTTHMAHPINIRCQERYILNPSNKFKLVRNESMFEGTEYEKAVQIQPQEISLKLRVGQAYDLRVRYSQAQDYPVDLYYLMDLSKSMEDDKETLSKLGGQLAEAMRRMTSKFKLGFGSFVDKVVMPFVSTVEKNLANPCPGCEAPYGYQNVMSLDQDTTRFAGEVERARVSGNLDAPEGGFDAVMQAIVCDQIGWRDEARRLLVFSTDASFHYAGDGKLGGIVKPNDGYCHMDSRGEYTHSTIQDYPSVAQINSKVKEKNIHMIFAVTAEQVNIYQKLTNSIQGSSCGELAANSSNVVELVREEYEKITSTVELKDTSSEFVRVSYFSTCLSHDSKDLIERNKCSDLRVGSIIEFLVKIELLKCPANRNELQSFEIYPVGLTERLRVELEMLCQCDCERDVVHESEHCGFHGTLSCGICYCDKDYFGTNCECNTTSGSKIDESACRVDNTTDIVCSNRGQCVCGQCQCNRRNDDKEVISGRLCQCDNFSCERENTLLCSGEDHGRCECGVCVCDESEWEGPACQCPKDKKKHCQGPDSDLICSGHGKCECGKCVCDTSGTERYSGKYCNRCPGCPDKCDFLKDCIQCYVHETGDFAETEEKCKSKCLHVGLLYPDSEHRVEKVDDAKSNEAEEEIYCSATDKTDDCRFYYVYGYNTSRNNDLYVRAQITKDCPPKPPIMWIIFGVVGAIVLVGLVFLLLWKLLTHIHDRAEYARFEKERMNAKWDAGENPIYKQATSTFKNPMYAGR